jgi:hypothetical protein
MVGVLVEDVEVEGGLVVAFVEGILGGEVVAGVVNVDVTVFDEVGGGGTCVETGVVEGSGGFGASKLTRIAWLVAMTWSSLT